MQRCSRSCQVLGLSPNAALDLTPEKLKTAYHAALLRNHPDKLPGVVPVVSGTTRTNDTITAPIFSVDEIVGAYQALLKLADRAVHDAGLENTVVGSPHSYSNETSVHAGVETYDLDELTFDESASRWYKQCRCGDIRGYVLEEAELEGELEGESELGEIYVGCTGCSLWIKVLFDVEVG